jgi:hypothetical protein
VDFEALVASRSNASDPALTLRNVALQNSWQVLSLLYNTALHPASQALTRVYREHFNFSAQQNFGAAGDQNLKPKSSNTKPQTTPQPGQAAGSGPLLRVAAQKCQCFDGCVSARASWTLV